MRRFLSYLILSEVGVGLVPLLALAPLYLSPPASAADVSLMALVGLVGLVAHGLVILAYRYAEASLLAPCVYFEIVGQASLGYLAFGDVPDVFTWVGIALMVLVGLFLVATEVKQKGERAEGAAVHGAAMARPRDLVSP